MTGPEHYREAEQLLADSRKIERGSATDVSMLAEAQVHATLALAAATALNCPHPEGGLTIPDYDQWMAAASAYKRPGQAT